MKSHFNNKDINFPEAVRKFLLDKKIYTCNNVNLPFERIFLCGKSEIVQRMLHYLYMNEDPSIAKKVIESKYQIYHNGSMIDDDYFIHGRCVCSQFRSNKNYNICKLCKNYKPCLIINLNEKDFYKYFKNVFHDIKLK